jgi:hypothetical protein
VTNSASIKCGYAECHSAISLELNMPNFAMLNVIMLNVVAPFAAVQSKSGFNEEGHEDKK